MWHVLLLRCVYRKTRDALCSILLRLGDLFIQLETAAPDGAAVLLSSSYSGRPVAGARSWLRSTCAGFGVRSSIAPVPASIPAPRMPPTRTFPAMATPPPVETLLVTVTVAS